MAQEEGKILPMFLNTDAAIEKLLPNESIFIKGIQSGGNVANPELGNGTNNATQNGQNDQVLVPVKSNQEVPNVIRPAGYNKNIGYFESVPTQEGYYFNYNSEGQSGIYVIDGNTGIWSTVLIDPKLFFTDGQEAFIAEHRVRLRVIYDENDNIVEKILLITNGSSWQKWILVNTAIKTNGFNSSLYPYWTLQPPHFDRRELFEWAVRPIMYNPVATAIPNTAADANKINLMIDQAMQFSAVVNYTDGRPTTFSPYSLPLIIKSEDFLNNPDELPKNAIIKIYAGSPMVESIDMYVRYGAKQEQGIPSTITWGNWQKYDRLYKFQDSETSEGNVLSTQYWLRTGAWSNYNYDSIFNTIEYPFDNSIQPEIASPDNALRIQSDLPQQSIAITDLGDAAALGGNRYFYDNFSDSVINNLGVVVQEKLNTGCSIPLRKIKLYAYIGRSGYVTSGGDSGQGRYDSQVGYYNGTDTQMRFGGLQMGGAPNNTVCNNTDDLSSEVIANICVQESTDLQLNFADNKAFRVYLKGTPYNADGTWAIINSDNSITPLTTPLDFSNNDVLTFVQNTFIAGGYFICTFELEVPAGRYLATLGRHNVPTTEDYRIKSTYIEGIANSKTKSSTNIRTNSQPLNLTSIKPNAIVSYSKEMELDCTSADIDVWGNGQDLFYVFCPYVNIKPAFDSGSVKWRFIEGYLFESINAANTPVELFPYTLTVEVDDWGRQTDKNGFYFGYTKADSANNAQIGFVVKLNCIYPVAFNIPTNLTGEQSGWAVNPPAFVNANSDLGACNRVLYTGKITSIDGLTDYSNIAISIKDGETVYSQSDGTFTLIIHNGENNNRISNVYVNAGSNFFITTENCGQVPLFQYNENLAPCISCVVRNYPIPLNLKLNIQGGTEFSLKENATYSIGCAAADLAGRLMYVNIVANASVPSFLSRGVSGDTAATYFQLLIKGALRLMPELKWFAPYVSNQLNILGYVQWVGDSIVYIDNNGNVVTDPASAVFCSISITSLYNYNVSQNFSLLASYQFVQGDRLRILDDGNGNLLSTNQYGQEINLPIYGTNYNQAVQNVGIVPAATTVPIVNNNNNISINTGSTTTSVATQQNNVSATLYVKYDSRLNKLINDTGFWIEIYTPSQQAKELPFNELEWKPVINGEVADFTGYNNGQPVYDFPTSVTINYWDTYLFYRNITIPNVGSKYFNHPFESPNISDTFGANVTSGGRLWSKNDDAKQTWYGSDVIKSDEFVVGNFVNGLGTFRSTNRKSFVQYPFGRIMGMVTQRSIVLFICENDWFTTDYQFHFTYANEQGVMVTNLDENLSTPHQKIGDSFGCSFEDTGTVVVHDKLVTWLDRKNEGYAVCDYRSAADISNIVDNEGKKYGIKSYMVKKIQFINDWNLSHDKTSRFDVIAGIDVVRKNIYLTFHPRRKNSNDLTSFISQRRNIDLRHQETLVYNLDSKRWVRFDNITPEGYGKIKGKANGQQFISFAAGKPYYHSIGNTSFLEFYGIQTEPSLIGVFNQKPEEVKILQSLSQQYRNRIMFVDLIYDNQYNSYSYIPLNLWQAKENVAYAAVLRDMVTYFAPNGGDYKSTLCDGKRIFGQVFIVRFVGDPLSLNDYFEILEIENLFTDSTPTKP